VIPKEVRERAGAKPGVEYEVATDGRIITLTPRSDYKARFEPITTEELLARRIKWDGPPITDEDIRRASAERASARFKRSMEE
jgi:bifunctional DNA-binding transcriptional regulator/antitoxin component of YhaV-PrlF toxin-antitoxin module